MAKRIATGPLLDVPRCPECGSEGLRNTPPTPAGRHRICTACNHMWHEPHRPGGSKKPPRPGVLTRWSYDEAFARFRQKFPGGFQDPDYAHSEREWKWEKHELWRDTVSPDGLRTLATKSPEKAAKLIERMIQTKSPMLHPQSEIVPMRDAVHRPELAGAYFAGLAGLLEAPSLTARVFENYVEALTSLPLIGKGNLDKWTIVTIIPFLAQPSRHMFLKPERTKDVTLRLGDDIRYTPAPNWDTYERLLDFSNKLLDFLKPHGARDMIDVQSFISVIAD